MIQETLFRSLKEMPTWKKLFIAESIIAILGIS
jgi:hypothetical protein